MKKFFAILSTILIFALSFCLPAFAYTYEGDPGDRLKPLWNLEAIEVYDGSGGSMLFELPQNFYTNSDDTYNQYITIDDPAGGDPFYVSFTNIHVEQNTDILYTLSFSTNIYAVDHVIFHFGDSYIPFRSLGQSVPSFSIQDYDYLSSSGTWQFGGFQYVDYGISSHYFGWGLLDYFYFGNTVLTSDGRICISPDDSFIASCVASLPEGDWLPNDNRQCLCFPSFTVRLDSDGYTDGYTTLRFQIPLVDASLDYTTSESYLQLYANLNYETGSGGGSVDLGSIGRFLGNTLSGFLSFQFAPGFTIGSLFVALTGILCIISFLRWFAGG